MKRVRKECSATIRFICEELGENLHSRKCAPIRRHLAGCPECADYLRSLKTIVGLYRSYPVPQLSEEARKRVRKALGEFS